MADPITTDAPTLISATRLSATTVKFVWENNAKTGAVYTAIGFDARELPAGQWGQVNQLTGNNAIKAAVFTHRHLDGLLGYEVALRAVGPAGASPRSNTKTLDPWWALPAAQTDMAAEYGSGDAFNLSWTEKSTTEAQYDYQYIFRSENGGVYSQINRLATNAVSGVPETYFDARAPKDRALRWRVWAANGAGGARFYSLPTGVLYTTPLVATHVSLRWLNDTTLRSTWRSPSTIADKWDVEYLPGGGTWTPITTATAKVADFVGTQGVTGRVRVRSVSPDGVKKSGWAYSSTIPSHRKPAQPLVRDSGAQDATGVVRLDWAHQPLDGSAQAWRQVRHRLVGAGSWTTESSAQSELEYRTLTAGTYPNGGRLEWQVRTRGASATWSDYSDSGFVDLRAKPQPSITYPTPGMVWPSKTLDLRWSVAGSQVGWSIEVRESPSGELVAVRESTGANATSKRTALLGVLEDATDYTVSLTVTTTDGVSDPAQVSISVALSRPGVPTLLVTPDHDMGTVQIVGSAAVTGQPTVAMEALGSRDGVVWESLGEADMTSGMLVYPIPPLWTDFQIKLRAFSAIPSQIDTEPQTVQVRSRDVIVNYGPGWGDAVHGGPRDFRDSVGREKVSHTFSGGRVRTFRGARRLPTVADVSVKLLPARGSSTLADWQAMLEHDGTVVYRDPSGTVLHGEVSEGGRDHTSKFVQGVSFQVQEKPWP